MMEHIRDTSRRHFIKRLSGVLTTLPLLSFSIRDITQKDYNRIIIRTSWDPANIGDFTTLPSAYKLTLKYIPRIEVLLWPASINESLSQVLDQNFTSVKILTGEIDDEGEPTTVELKDALSTSDLLLYLPGAQPAIDWTGTSSATETRSLQYCKKINLPYIVYGIGNNLLRDEEFKFLEETLNNAALSVYTHPDIPAQLKDRKIKIDNFDEGIDPIFGFDLRKESDARNFLEDHGIGMRSFFAINYLTLENKPEKNKEYLKKLRSLIKYWTTEYEHDILLIPVNKEDFERLTDLQKGIPSESKKRVIIYEGEIKPSLMASIFMKSRIVISMSPELSYLTLQSGIPLIHLTLHGQDRIKHVFSELGIKDYILDFDKASEAEFIEFLTDINEDYLNALLDVKKARENSQKILRKSFENINKTLIKIKPLDNKKKVKKKK